MTKDEEIARSAWICAIIALAIGPLSAVVWFFMLDSQSPAWLWGAFTVLPLLQMGVGIAALVQGLRGRRRLGGGGIAPALLGSVATVAAPVGWVFGVLLALLAAGGGAWGRPLRVRGRQLHPELQKGSDWTRGAEPDPSQLDEPTRLALEALWLHDAQKEHASVPAFSRISWMLASVGAPADLLEWCHRAALEEIEHTRLCFALAAGYGGQSHSVQAMPALMAGMEVSGNPLLALARESLADGCQLEDFNADVAAACAVECEEPATLAVLEQVAREERSHAEFSWALLGWLLSVDRAHIEPELLRSLEQLQNYRRPTAVSWDKRPLVKRANPELLRRNGRLPDERWGDLWEQRLAATRKRLLASLDAVALDPAA